VASLPPTVIEALEAFVAPDKRGTVHDLAQVAPDEADARLQAVLESADWVDMNAKHPVGPDRSDPEGMRRLLQAMGAESRCAVVTARGSEDDRDLGGTLDQVLQHQDNGAIVVCRPGPLAFLVTATDEHWLLSDREMPLLTGQIPVIRA
jgi:hypothetical protein